jgi:hypothetical protein
MRFEGTRTYDIPASTLWRAIRDPDTLEHIIPNCHRIERQPGYQPDSDIDFSMGFEIGTTDEQTGAEPIIGWLEVDHQSPRRHLTLTVTLNDALAFLRIEGTLHFHARGNGNQTELRYNFNARFPEVKGNVDWSAEAHAQAEQVISDMLDKIPDAIEVVPSGVSSTTYQNVEENSKMPRVLTQNHYGQVVLMPQNEVPTTQSMLRRLEARDERRALRRYRLIGVGVCGGLMILTAGALTFFLLRRSITSSQ